MVKLDGIKINNLIPKRGIRKGGFMEEKNNPMSSGEIDLEKYHVDIDEQTHILLTEIAAVKKQVDSSGRFLERIYRDKFGIHEKAEKQNTADKNGRNEISVLTTEEGRGILVVNGARFDVVDFEARSSANGEAELFVKIKGKELFTALSSS